VASRIELRVPHTLAPDDALARIAALAEYYQHRHHAKVTWPSERVVHIEVRYLGVRIDARAAVEAGAIVCDATDPGFLLRGRGLKYLSAKLRRYLDAPRLEDLPRA
jgi:hypothetical protein